MAAVAQVREREPRHADQPVHVRLEHRLLVGLVALVERIAAEREAGRVDEHVEPAAESLHGLLDEALAARGIGDVELERDLRVDPVDAPRPAGDARGFATERGDDCRADPTRGAGDDRGLAVERGHGRGA